MIPCHPPDYSTARAWAQPRDQSHGAREYSNCGLTVRKSGRQQSKQMSVTSLCRCDDPSAPHSDILRRGVGWLREDYSAARRGPASRSNPFSRGVCLAGCLVGERMDSVSGVLLRQQLFELEGAKGPSPRPPHGSRQGPPSPSQDPRSLRHCAEGRWSLRPGGQDDWGKE